VKEYLDLFLVFLKLGCITFGGGYAMVPVVDRELIKKRGWVNMDEVMDYYTIAQITPGIIAINLSTFVGYKQKGVLGGILATVGFIIPGISIIVIAALFIRNLADIPAVQHAFTGIRIAVGALILNTVINLVKGVFKDFKAPVIYIVVFLLSVLPAGIIPGFLKSPVLLVIVSGLVGILIYRQKKPGEGRIASPDDRDEPGKQP